MEFQHGKLPLYFPADDGSVGASLSRRPDSARLYLRLMRASSDAEIMGVFYFR
jgi:hypothetical protein